jgi:hypothetical protein
VIWLGGPFAPSPFHWFVVLVVAFMTAILMLIVLGYWRDRYVFLEELPGLSLSELQLAEIRGPEPARMRITIRHLMSAVAVLAVLLGAAAELARSSRQAYYLGKARFHARFEDLFRKLERDQHDRLGPNVIFLHQLAASTNARAEYHAALRRKYEEAASRRWLSIEPDPPKPSWP